MKSLRLKVSSVVLVLVSLLGASFAMAEAKPAAVENPQAVVEKVTAQLFGLVKARTAKDTDEAYYAGVEKVLNDVVDFPFIAMHVMGGNAFKSASKEQRNQFLNVFRSGLVKSYAKGIAGYANSDVKVVGVAVDKKNAKRAAVHQEVTEAGVTHQLDYTMVNGDDGQWRLINVTLNGVNLGVSFQSQFKAAMRKYGNDLDKVIANWLADA